jgi:hypothetical protein
MAGGRARARTRGISAGDSPAWTTEPQKGQGMRTRSKAISVGPALVIVAASSRLPGTGGWRHKRKEGVLRRRVTAVPNAVTRARAAARQLERAGMVLGALMAGLELVRELRVSDSNGTPSRAHSSGRSAPRGSSQSRSSRPANSRSRTGSSSGGDRSSAKSPRRATRTPPRSRATAKKARGRTTATKRSVPRATAKKAGRPRPAAKTQAGSRTPAKRTTSSGRSRSSSRRR